MKQYFTITGLRDVPKKNSLVENINRRKKSGTSRSKKKSTVSPEAYQEMEKGWPKKTQK